MLLWKGSVVYTIESMKNIEGQAFNTEGSNTVAESEPVIKYEEIEKELLDAFYWSYFSRRCREAK